MYRTNASSNQLARGTGVFASLLAGPILAGQPVDRASGYAVPKLKACNSGADLANEANVSAPVR